jgi:hypothetical protein
LEHVYSIYGIVKADVYIGAISIPEQNTCKFNILFSISTMFENATSVFTNGLQIILPSPSLQL